MIRRLFLKERLGALALCVVAVAGQLACAGAESIARRGVEGGVGGGLEALNDPINREMLRQLLQDPEIQQAAHDLTAAISGGALDGVTEEARMLRVREASDAYIQTISAAVGKALDEQISPSLTRGVGDVLGGAVASAMRPGNARLARVFVDDVTRAAITAFTQSTAQGLRDDLGPALHQVLEKELGPGLQRVIEDNLGPALRTVIERDLQPILDSALGGGEGGATGALARAMTRQIVLGVNDGMSELGMSLSPNHEDGPGLFKWIPIVLGVLLLILIALMFRMNQTRLALAQDRARSEDMLVSILRAIKTEDEPGAAPDFNTVIARARQQIPDREGYEAYLANIITRAQLPPIPIVPPRRLGGPAPPKPPPPPPTPPA